MTWIGKYNEEENDLVRMEPQAFMAKLHEEFPEFIGENEESIGVGPGWRPIIYDILKRVSYLMRLSGDGQFEIEQIKEKFGKLRFYFDTTDMDSFVLRQIISLIVDEGCDQSGYHCEDCGSIKEVTIEGPGWIRTLCKECRIK